MPVIISDKSLHNFSYHKHFKSGYLYGTGLITGCGAGQIHGVGYYNSEVNLKSDLLPIITAMKENGIGSVICTLGQPYYNNEQMLLDCGFKFVSEYSNYRHDSNGLYKQKIYILTL